MDGKLTQKTFAWITTILFTATNVVAAPAAPAMSPTPYVEVVRTHFLAGVEFPELLGSVQAQSVQNTVSSVIHIQDAHGSFEAQENIKAILEHLTSSYDVDTIFVEGASEEINPELFRFFKSKDTNDKLVPALVRDNLIGGPEWFVYENDSKKSLNVYGVENSELYQKNLEHYREVLRQNEKATSFVESMQRNLMSVGSKIMNKELNDFMRDWTRYQNTPDQILAQLNTLRKAAKKELDLDLNNSHRQVTWPQLVRVTKLQVLEKELNSKQAERELAQLKEWINAKELNEDILKLNVNRTEVETFYARVKDLGFSFENYPTLAKYWAFSIIQSEMNAAELMTEINALTDMILAKLAKTEAEKSLVALYKDVQLLEKLYHLELIEAEHSKLLAKRDSVFPSALLKRLAKVSKNKVQVNTEMDALYESALTFYEAAREREVVIYENMIRHMKRLNEQNVVLITGGFHTEGLASIFESKGISYVSVAPRISQVEGHDGYVDAMLLEGDYLALRSHAKQDGLANILARHANPIIANLMTTKLIRTSVEISPTEVAAGLFENVIHQIEIFQLENGDSIVYRAQKPVVIDDDDDKVLTITQEGLLSITNTSELEGTLRSESRKLNAKTVDRADEGVVQLVATASGLELSVGGEFLGVTTRQPGSLSRSEARMVTHELTFHKEVGDQPDLHYNVGHGSRDGYILDGKYLLTVTSTPGSIDVGRPSSTGTWIKLEVLTKSDERRSDSDFQISSAAFHNIMQNSVYGDVVLGDENFKISWPGYHARKSRQDSLVLKIESTNPIEVEYVQNVQARSESRTLEDALLSYGFGRAVIDEVFRLANETASPKLHDVMSDYLTSVLGPELSADAMLVIEQEGAQHAIDVMRAAISPKYAWLFNTGSSNENAEMTIPIQGVPTASELSGIIANHLTNPRDEINVVLHGATETQAESLYEKLVKRALRANQHSSIARRLKVVAVNESKEQLVRTLQKIVGSENPRVSEQALISAKKDLLEKVGHRGARLVLSPEKLDENTAITITAVMLRDQVVADGYSIEEIRQWANAKGIDLNLLVKRIAQALKALEAVLTSA